MPKAVPVTFEDYLQLQFKLESIHFHEATEKERLMILARMESLEKTGFRRPSRGGETCLIYVYGRYLVVVWTSCLRRKVRECRFREEEIKPDELPFHRGIIVSRPEHEDAGRVVIRKIADDGSEKAKYFANVNRTKGFVRNLARQAWFAAYKISHLPQCQKCGEKMEIVKSSDGGNYYGCFNTKNNAHSDGRPFFLDFHEVLPPRAKKLKEQRDRAAARQRRMQMKTATEQGKKSPERAFVVRARAK